MRLTSGAHHADPLPYRHPDDANGDVAGLRYSYPIRFLSGTSIHAPRPEFDNHNPVLVSFRKMQTLYPRQSINSRAWGYLSSLSSLGIALGASQDQITHARRVLRRLAYFTKESK